MSETKIKRVAFGEARPQGKAPRVSVAIEPTIAAVFRELARQERFELSQLLAQALIAWIRRWRPQYAIEIDGPEGPADAMDTNIVAISSGTSEPQSVAAYMTDTVKPGPAVGMARKITKKELMSYGDMTPNPPRRERGSGGRSTKRRG